MERRRVRELKQALGHLKDTSPGAFVSSSLPSASRPAEVDLQAWALDIAADLHTRFGEHVVLRVGAFGYPGMGHPAGHLPRYLRSPASALNLRVVWDQPVVVVTGHDVLVPTTVCNLGDQAVSLSVGEFLTAWPIDETGAHVGALVGMIHDIGRVLTVAPGGETVVPAVLSTASSRPELGYALPPGDWRAVVELESTGPDGTVVVSEPLAFTIAAF
jgi:hypothetical protein